MGLWFFRVGGRGGSWKLPVALLGVHTPTEKSATNLRNASIHRLSSSWINPANFGELRQREVHGDSSSNPSPRSVRRTNCQQLTISPVSGFNEPTSPLLTSLFNSPALAVSSGTRNLAHPGPFSTGSLRQDPCSTCIVALVQSSSSGREAMERIP
jgi:hypothetical protein